MGFNDHRQQKVLVGLGNPGREYEGTRHNLGFRLVDTLYKECLRDKQAVPWKEKFGNLISTISIHFEGSSINLIVAKPQGYMNRSGGPVAELTRFFKVPLEDLIVVHDEVDLPVGTLRIKSGGGDGGHNGIRSLSGALGSGEYVRVRMGVGRPVVSEQEGSEGADVSRWVLGKFREDEKKIVDDLVERTVAAIKVLCVSGLKTAQNTFN